MSRPNRQIKKRGSHLPKVHVRMPCADGSTAVFATRKIDGCIHRTEFITVSPPTEPNIMKAVRKIRGYPIE